MDITAVGALLSSLKTAADIAKFIRTSDLTIEKAETKLKLAELVSTLADVKLAAAEIQQALLERDERIRSLEGEAKIRASLVYGASPAIGFQTTRASVNHIAKHAMTIPKSFHDFIPTTTGISNVESVERASIHWNEWSEIRPRCETQI